MTYKLASVARRAGIKRNKTLRPIFVTQELKKSLYALSVASVRELRVQVKDRLLPAYGAAVDSMTRDDQAEDLASVLTQIELVVDGVVVTAVADLPDWFRVAIRWHDQKWRSSVRGAVGVDVYPFPDQLRYDTRIKAFQNAAADLIRDVSDKVKTEIKGIVWRGLTQQTPRAEIGKQISERMNIARCRANLIAIDQANKLSGELTAIRMEEAGLDSYVWKHSGKVHYRPHHKARDGKVYKMGEPKGDQPGWAPYCGCVRAPVVDVDAVADERVAA